MLKAILKRAALRGTVASGTLQRRIGTRFPRYAMFWRRTAGYAAYAMAGEPFVPEARQHTEHDGPAAGPVRCGDIMAWLDGPAGPIESGFVRVHGWVTGDRGVGTYAVVNGNRVRLNRYARPDVVPDAHEAPGFCAFVRLLDLGGPSEIHVLIANESTRLIERTLPVLPSALETSQLDEFARRHKRAWIIPRLSCVACGGDLDTAAVCRSCHTNHGRDELLDCIPPDMRELADIEFTGAVFSHPYDGDVERIIAGAEAAGGKVLDCGAGLRPTIRQNVITTEIFPYPTTDVLAVNHRLPFRDGIFDAVLSLHVLEHVPDPFACARELYRVLKPGGTLFAITPMVTPEHGAPHHFFNPTREGLARLFGRTCETARVFMPAAGHPINGVWSVLGVYRDGLPEPQRTAFGSLRVRDILARSIGEWIEDDVAVALDDTTRMRIATNFCIELVK